MPRANEARIDASAACHAKTPITPRRLTAPISWHRVLDEGCKHYDKKLRNSKHLYLKTKNICVMCWRTWKSKLGLFLMLGYRWCVCLALFNVGWIIRKRRCRNLLSENHVYKRYAYGIYLIHRWHINVFPSYREWLSLPTNVYIYIYSFIYFSGKLKLRLLYDSTY